MQFFSPRKKKHSKAPFTSTPTSGLASSQVTQQLQSLPQVPTYSQSQSQSQSHLQSPQGKQQSQPVCPWSTHTPPSGRWPSPFPRCFHALSTAATSAGELFLFGGSTPDRIHNDLYIISTRDFSTTLLNTSGDIPNPRYAHHAVLTSTTLLIWGGTTEFSDQNAQNQSDDDSFYLLNLGTSDPFHFTRPAPADQSFLRSSIARLVPHRGRWSRARPSLLPYHDVGWFQALRLRWPDRQEPFK
jgi:hypothetical protein